MLEKAFLDGLFTRKKWESKVVEFINLCQRGMNVLEYSSNFIKISKYAPSLVSDPRDAMNCFVRRGGHITYKINITRLHDNMNISYIMVDAQHVEEALSKRKSRDANRKRSFDGGSSKGRLEIQEKPRIKKMVYNRFHLKFPKSRDDRVSNPKAKKGRDTSSPTRMPICGECDKKHHGDCLRGMENYFCCCKSRHKAQYSQM